ncbi:MAG TPA: glycerate kinase [Actinomycetes bacterium]|nr:glycerate kinase [Actinomycetes bacterium]
MRILVAPDKFAGTLTAIEAAQAIAAGWRVSRPDDEFDLVPMSDGGPGFVDTLHRALDGEIIRTAVTGPLGDRVSAPMLRAGDRAYLESASACGLDLLPPSRRDPEAAGTYGVGESLLAALGSGAAEIVVGLGGSASNDGGAGMLAALGAEPGAALRRGGAGLAELTAVDLAKARDRVAGRAVVAATDVDNPLLGPQGATAVYAPQKGASQAQIARLEAALARWVTLTDGDQAAARPGSGAAGGLGFGLFLLGAVRVPGSQLVMDAVRLAERAGRADLVVTGEGALDWQSVRGKVVAGVAWTSQRAARPCVVLAGLIELGRREIASMGVDAAYSITELAGSPEAARADPAGQLRALAARVARTWSPA